MPRGVYVRKSAQQKAARKVAGKAKAKPVPALAAASAPAASPVQPDAEPQFSAADFRKPVDQMTGLLLKAFARRVGIKQRDVDNLTEDRLRQNCKAMQLDQLED